MRIKPTVFSGSGGITFKLSSGIALTAIIVLFCSISPVSGQTSQTVVFAYSDFGPPSLARGIIGMDWWQWDNHGDSRPRSYDIKVVVYRSLSIERVKQLYPVLREKRRDFRYLEYSRALEYLDKAIRKTRDDELDAIRKIAERLRMTRSQLVKALGKP